MTTRQSERNVILPVGSPIIVVLCGSTRFTEVFARYQNEFTIAGYIVLTVGCVTHSDDELFGAMPPADRRLLKAKLDVLHFHKIMLADEILVLNVDNYVGDSTLREVLYAISLGKFVRWLEPPSRDLLHQLGIEEA